MTHFGGLEPFLGENQDVAPTKIKRLRDVFQDEDERKNLIIELAAVINGGKAFVQTTHKLESGVPLIFTAYFNVARARNSGFPMALSNFAHSS